MSGALLLSPADIGPQVSAIHSNATITANGSSSFLTYGAKEITLLVNIKAAPTGTAPTLTFFLEEMDPGDQATQILTTINTGALNAIGTYAVTLRTTRSGCVRVRWTISGASASFTQVYTTLQQKFPGVALGVDMSGVERPIVVDALGRLLLGSVDTFDALSLSTALGNGKSMMSLLNAGGSGVVIRVREIWLENAQTTAVTGVAADFRFRRITAHSGGTALTPTRRDASGGAALNGSVTVRTGATVTEVASSDFARKRWSSDEWGTGTLDQEGLDHAMQSVMPQFRAEHPASSIVLRPGEGIHVLCNTNTTAGAFDLRFVFTQTPS